MVISALPQIVTQPVYSATAVLSHEAEVAKCIGIKLVDLMNDAGNAVFQKIIELYPDLSSMLILCGKGNNGGDGYVVARLAAQAGIEVSVLMMSDEHDIKGDALTHFNKLKQTSAFVFSQGDIENLLNNVKTNDFDIIVDGLFGIGFKGVLREPHATLVQQINNYPVDVISIDVPSGVNANTGAVNGIAMKAKATVSFIVLKKGLLTGPALECVGDLYLADLKLRENFQARIETQTYWQGSNLLPRLIPQSINNYKGKNGRILFIGGNENMPGAIRLAGEAALRCGAGLVSIHCHKSNKLAVSYGRPELMLADVTDLTVEALNETTYEQIAIGPGLGRDEWAEVLFNKCFNSDKPLIVDADGLYWLSQQKVVRGNMIITPHSGEAARLLNCSVEEVEQNRCLAAKQLAQQYNAICVLKGAHSIVTDGVEIWINSTGNPSMASGGMGDTLTGMIASLLFKVKKPLKAVRLAVYIHGLAADNYVQSHGKIGLLASDLMPIMSKVLGQLYEQQHG